MDVENNSNTLTQVYYVGEEEVSPSAVHLVICIFIQRGFLVAGFNSQKELLTIHYSGYEQDKIVWESEFFHNIVSSHPLLEDPQKVRAAFILSDKNMIVPNDLYKDNHAKSWLKHIHFIEEDDVVESYPLDQERAMYMMAFPSQLRDLIKNKLPNALIQPMALYQFIKTPKIGLCLQCCVTNNQVCATLHIDGNLLWHKVFEYAAAEDIVFEGKYLCKENNYFATKLTILCNALTGAEYSVLSDYSQYYPAMKSGEGNRIHSNWDAPTALVQQLLTCVL